MSDKSSKPQPKPKQKPVPSETPQPEAIVKEKKEGRKLFGKIPFGAGVVYALVLAAILLILVVGKEYLPSKKPSGKEPSSAPSSETTPPPSEEPESEEPEKPILPIEQQLTEGGVEQLLDGIYAGKVEPNVITDEISSFGKDYDFNIGEGEENEWIELRITVYPYIPGKKILRRYETLPTWERSFDKEVELFLNLKPGKQVTTIFDHGPPETAEVNFRKIGDRYFAVYNTMFSPSNSFTRHYFNYDKATRQLIYIYVIFYDFYAVQSSIVETAVGEGYLMNVVYPGNFQRFLDGLEKLL